GAWIDRRPADMLAFRASLFRMGIMEDPEAMFQEGWLFVDGGDHARGLEMLQRSIRRGYFAAETLAGPVFDPLRNDPAFQSVVADAEAGRERARITFREAGGERLLGIA